MSRVTAIKDFLRSKISLFHKVGKLEHAYYIKGNVGNFFINRFVLLATNLISLQSVVVFFSCYIFLHVFIKNRDKL